MAKKVIDIELRPTGGGVRQLNDQLKELKKNVSTATDTKDVNKLNTALKQTEQEVESINSAISGFDLKQKFDDVYQGIAPLSSQLGELEDRMYQLAFSGKANTEEFKALQVEAIKMRQTIIQVDKQVDIMADNQGLAVFGDGIAGIGASLLRLDFDTASKQASTLAENAGKISFGEATKSLKALGSTFVSLGKALLTNPLFIIATVIGLIVVGIVALLDKMGVLKVIFEAVGDAIGWVVQQLKDFLDWIGLTDFAAEDAAKNTIERNKKIIESEREKNNFIIDGYDHQIQLAKIRGEDTKKLELERIKALQKSAQEQIKLNGQILVSTLKLHGADSDEYKEAVKNAKDAIIQFREANQEMEIFTATTEAEIRDEREKTAAESAALAKEYADKAKQYAMDRLNAERQIEDLRIALIQDATAKEVEENRVKFERLIEDTKTSVILTESEKLKIIAYYEEQSLQLAKDTLKKKTEAERVQMEAIAKLRQQAEVTYLNEEEEIAELIYQAGLSRDQKEIIAVQDKYFQLIELARQHGLDSSILEEEQEAQIGDIKERYAREERERIEAEKQARIASFKAQYEEGANLFSSLEGLSNAVMEAQIAGAEGNEAKQEQIRKKSFERNKALQITMATISGIQGVINALTAQSVIPDPFGTILKAVNAAVVGATTIANIAKIKATKYKGGGGGGGASASTGAAAGASAASAVPNISMFGQANDLNSLSSAKSVEKETPTIKAIVVESDISDMQKKVKRINESAEL